jgi:DNA repair exonuclease SbcCD nuclease subunit
MNNILIFSDLHITQESLKECIFILEEIGSIVKEHDIDTVINLGDTFDNLKPTSAEFDAFATFIKRLNKNMIVIAASSHESENTENSIVNHFGILSENVEVVTEYTDGSHMFCGHFIVKEAKKSFGTTISKKDLNYKYVWLGHQHSFEIIKPQICQLGSSRFVKFDEYLDKKQVAIILNYKEESEKVYFVPLKSPIPMKVIHLDKNNIINNLNAEASDSKSLNLPQQNPSNPSTTETICGVLDKIDPKTKVKVVVHDFTSYKALLKVEDKYRLKFIKYVRENDFTLVSEFAPNNAKKETQSLKESFKQFANEKQVDESLRQIIDKEIL